MKKLTLLLSMTLAVMIGFSVTAFAQNKATDGKIYINAKGGMYNSAGARLGYIDKNNRVKDNAGRELYFIDKGGNVISADGRRLGFAKMNGSFANSAGQSMVTTKDIDKENCAILDPQGHNMGTTHKNYKLHACAIHCYWLTKAKENAAKNPN
jgi:hypothetical protein